MQNLILKTSQVMLAGRDIGLGVGVLTMGATWVGGGFINGSAQVGCCGDDGDGDVVAVTWVGVLYPTRGSFIIITVWDWLLTS